MTTNLDRLKARRDAVIAEINAIATDKAGGVPNRSGGSVNVDHQGYKKGLYEELDKLDELITREEGPHVFETEAWT